MTTVMSGSRSQACRKFGNVDRYSDMDTGKYRETQINYLMCMTAIGGCGRVCSPLSGDISAPTCIRQVFISLTNTVFIVLVTKCVFVSMHNG